jgi:hypothetical protein
MAPSPSLTAEVISQAESYDGICAGIVRLKDVLKGPSYQSILTAPRYTDQMDDVPIDNWPAERSPLKVVLSPRNLCLSP